MRHQQMLPFSSQLVKHPSSNTGKVGKVAANMRIVLPGTSFCGMPWVSNATSAGGVSQRRE